MQDQLMAKKSAMFKAHIQMQDRIIAKDKAMFVEIIQKQDQVIAKLNGMLGARDVQHVKLYEEVKSLFFTRINANQWARIESVMGIIRHYDRTHFNNIQSRSHVRDAEHPQAPRLYPANIFVLTFDPQPHSFNYDLRCMPGSHEASVTTYQLSFLG
nr:hypothetical protein [Tanacetum cinerariifolium]